MLTQNASNLSSQYSAIWFTDQACVVHQFVIAVHGVRVCTTSTVLVYIPYKALHEE